MIICYTWLPRLDLTVNQPHAIQPWKSYPIKVMWVSGRREKELHQGASERNPHRMLNPQRGAAEYCFAMNY